MIDSIEGVIPANAGIQVLDDPIWMPACAGMTFPSTSMAVVIEEWALKQNF
jgi:hypothetical protein